LNRELELKVRLAKRVRAGKFATVSFEVLKSATYSIVSIDDLVGGELIRVAD
jgi:hypothetical protein